MKISDNVVLQKKSKESINVLIRCDKQNNSLTVIALKVGFSMGLIDASTSMHV